MTDGQPRTREQRKVDTLAKLTAPAADVWVATAAADAGGHASSYLVPLSLAWIDERVVLATEAGSVTAGNITSQGGARLGLGPTRDVVMIDAELEHATAWTRFRPAWPAGTRRRRAGTRASRASRCGSWCCGRCGSRPGASPMNCPGGP